jgi:hypothetical protein
MTSTPSDHIRAFVAEMRRLIEASPLHHMEKPMSEQNIASATDAAIGHGIIQGLSPFKKSPSEVRYDCLRIAASCDRPLGKSIIEHAADLADFVFHDRVPAQTGA